jgi:hypothetical protein
MATKVTYATKCGIPGCWEPRVEGGELCQEHLDLGYLNDYLTFKDHLEEGVSRQQAAVLAGLSDPPE